MTTQISGTTGVSQVQDGVVTQVDLGVNVVGNGPAFSAYQSTPQSITASPSKLLFQTEEFDTSNSFDAVTTSRYQPLIAGYYQINGAFQSSITTAAALISLYKNGVLLHNGTYSNISVGNPLVTVASLIYLNGSSDYVELFASQTTTGNSVAGVSSTYFQGFLVRAA